MIRLVNLCKTYVERGQSKVVADTLNITFPTGKTTAILGRNGAGKSSLLRMIAGTMAPDSGRVVSDGSISWPVGYAGSFHGELTGAQNARFLARVYGVDTEAMLDFVEDFAELDKHFHLPVRTYSSGMRARLAFAVSMSVDFDTYLIDEITSVGDAAFKEKSEALFADRMQGRSALMVTHALGMVLRTCQAVAVLDRGKLHHYTDVQQGIWHHQRLLKAAPAFHQDD
jgi:capsular polysaccharide transport system ATP-binding protein